ncbi:YiiX/YebB-like N1pC/P60 family cysteine hydrolase [Acidocella sp.]|uniref:YiiX/YebB-like N1pC/P60 family cysteine hydrolase n=1 Tax=Acidocella sp. TaxID=50710 RepID=UPI002622B230|nr:YiiX/YebB-like N1pC/P60 family cysteine hydrolase [Acidocella sp.]MDD2794853.1 YiiX/YebB-like N1pC/P60 family cysteine hydrolase [Acidocella sp.]
MRRIQQAIGHAIARFLTVPVDAPPVFPVDLRQFRALLQPGDVILVEGRLRISSMVKYLTQSTWSHAVLYAGDAAPGGSPDCIEADIIAGVRRFNLEALLPYHVRICRPIGLSTQDRQAVVDFAMSKLGTQYDLRYVVDLARYLFPLPVPQRWRRRAIGFLSADPTRAICSTLIAQAFKNIGYPILPEITEQALAHPATRRRALEIFHIHGSELFVPRDFDVSPFFEIIKPDTPSHFDYHRLVWLD